MLEILLTKGIPASGKSTFARELVAKGGWIQSNKDELREMLHISKWSKTNEKFVLSVRDYIVEEALKDGKNVVISDTNLDPAHFKRMCQIAQQFDKDITVWEKYFPIELEEAIKRNEKRLLEGGNKLVTKEVIEKLYNRHVKDKKITEKKEIFLAREIIPASDKSKLERAIICDLDGTLAIIGDRSPYDASRCHEVDTINGPILETILALYNRGYKLVFCSGREDRYEEQTRKFIDKYLTKNVCRQEELHIDYEDKEIIPYELFMRKAGDQRRDSLIKAEIYKEHIEPKYNVLLTLDDRQQVVRGWRELGLTCLQVAEGMF